MGKIVPPDILCKKTSSVASKSQNCHNYNSARATHENVRFLAFFCHIKFYISISTASKYMDKMPLKSNKSMLCSTTNKWTAKRMVQRNFAYNFMYNGQALCLFDENWGCKEVQEQSSILTTYLSTWGESKICPIGGTAPKLI